MGRSVSLRQAVRTGGLRRDWRLKSQENILTIPDIRRCAPCPGSPAGNALSWCAGGASVAMTRMSEPARHWVFRS
jgi:hypothetical protein